MKTEAEIRERIADKERELTKARNDYPILREQIQWLEGKLYELEWVLGE